MLKDTEYRYTNSGPTTSRFGNRDERLPSAICSFWSISPFLAGPPRKTRELLLVPFAAMQSFITAPKERRRFQRVDLSLSGRYMLRNRHEYPCWTINISAGGIAVLALEKGLIGERVVADFNHIGRVEGMIARNFDSCFALSLQGSLWKTEKLARVLAWLVSRQTEGKLERRAQVRVRPHRRRISLTTPHGSRHQATMIDASTQGAALNTDLMPPVGSVILVGGTAARVVRHLETGVAVKFNEKLPAKVFDASTRL
jgi:PilZ domain